MPHCSLPCHFVFFIQVLFNYFNSQNCSFFVPPLLTPVLPSQMLILKSCMLFLAASLPIKKNQTTFFSLFSTHNSIDDTYKIYHNLEIIKTLTLKGKVLVLNVLNFQKFNCLSIPLKASSHIVSSAFFSFPH